MSNQNLSNLDDKEFDSFIEDIIDAPPSANFISDFTPWNHSMKYALLGLGLTSLTLNFLCLDMILPCIGYILMFLGFRSLKNENNWFKTCYYLTNVKLVFWLITLFLNASVCFQAFENSTYYQVLLYIFIGLTLLLFIAVRNAIRSVQRKAGFKPHGGNGIVICYLIIIFLGMINFSGFSVFGLAIAYICALRSLYQLSKELNQAGYAIKASSVKISDRIITIGYTFTILIILIVSYGFCNKYPMDWQPKTETAQENTIEIREELLSLGFPEEVLNDMTTAEILSCDNAANVLVDTTVHEFIEDHSTLKMTFIGVKHTDERDRWKVIHYFEWIDTPDFCGTEAIQFWPTDHSETWHVSSDFTGRVLYNSDGTTYVSDYYILEKLTYLSNGIFWGESNKTDLFAAFSMPSGVTGQRGYVMYECLENMDGAILDSWFNYTHQMNQFQFPVKDAVAYSMTESMSEFTFKKIQTALQIFTHEEEPKLAY